MVTRNLLFVYDIKATRKDEDEDGFTWEIKSNQYDEKDITGKQIQDSKIVWALYDSVSKPCEVLTSLY
jgi:hypothetical protein